ncbi:MAG TPA: hypothetical protein PLM63_03125 [bacterium]|nr:hypothetical protein [bacterium]
MRLKKIQLKNFLSFYNSEIDLIKDYNEPPTTFLINGINYDNDTNDSSNGSGKSAFISESLMFNIYGRGLRGSKQKVKLNEMIRHGAKEMLNSVEYFISEDNANQILKIKRTKSEKTSSTEIEIDGESKTKRLKRLSDTDIRSFINLEPELFAQTIVYYKDNVNLLSMNYGQRIDLFKKIINLEIIDESYEKARTFKNSNEKYLDYLKNLKKSTINIIEIIDNNKEKYKDYLQDELNNCLKELDDILKVEFESTEEYEENIKNFKKEIESIDKEIKNINNKVVINKNSIEKIDKELKKIKALSGGLCPTCKQLVTSEYTSTIELEYEKTKTDLLKEIENYLISSEEFSSKKKIINNILLENSNKIKEIESKKMIHEQSVNAINKQIKKLNNDINNIKIENLNNEDKNKYEKKLKSIEKAILIRTDWKNAIEYWFNLFSPKSLLRASIIRKYVILLSDIFEYYISKLYNNEIIGKIEIDDDSNIDIILYKDKYETNYWQMSSGERKRIDVAMILSLYEFTSHIKPNLPKFLILDEIFDSLDYPGVNAVIETLNDVQKRHQIDLYLISHISIPISYDNVKNILVSKKDKNSTVKFLE